ncbi:MAG: glutathione S-transferase family protein [Hyphomicrobiaceae bacterium]
MHLFIGNKLYSSWSLRVWFLLTAFDFEFSETVIPLDEPDTAARIMSLSAAGRVPVLKDDGVVIWESLSIIEYLHDRFPERRIWPLDSAARAHARSAASEMHASFLCLRSACPMNLGKRFARRDRGVGVAEDVKRIEALWDEARTTFGVGSDDPFLYGQLSAADAMFAPVVSRLDTYNIDVTSRSRMYMDAVLSHPAFVAWREAAVRETWIVASDEVPELAIADLRDGMS